MASNLPNLSLLRHAPSGPKKGLAHIPELDCIRGIAALMVVFHHLFFTSVQHPERWNRLVIAISVLSHAGQYGVDLFFVLSGFLITTLLGSDRGSPHYYWNFYWKRAIRILPLYLLALAILAALIPSARRYALLSLFFAANFGQVWHIPGAGPFWTLAIEEQFYLVWPRLVRGLCERRLLFLSLTVAIGSPVLRLMAAASNHFNYQLTFLHCDGLALGAALACQRITDGAPSGMHNLSSRKMSRWFLVLPGIALTVFPLFFDPTSKYGRVAWTVEITGVSLLCYRIIGLAIQYSGSRFLSILRGRALTFLGTISYCLYIVNGYVVIAYDKLAGPIQPGNMTKYWVRAGVVFGACVLISLAARYAVELPAGALRKYVLRYPSDSRIMQQASNV